MFEQSDNFQEFATLTPSSARFKIDTTGTDQQYATQTPSSARFKIDPTGLQQHDMEPDNRIKNVVDVILQGAKAAPTERRFPLVPFNELIIGTSPAYLVKGLIPRVGIAVVWGPPKCGKSFWTFDLVMHSALGRDYRGRRVMPGTVVYCAFEGAEGFKARATAFRQQHDIEPGAEVPFFLVPLRMDLVKEHRGLIASIQNQIGDSGPVSVTLDTLNRSLRGSESSDEDMTAYLNAADAIREAFGCVVIIVHHCGIDGTRPRGHTSLTGTVDAQLAVKRDGANNIVVTVEHMKDGAEGAVIASRLETAELGLDDDGDPITSCVVVPVERTALPAADEPRLSRNQQTMFSILYDAKRLTLEQWNEKTREAGIGVKRKADLVDIRTALKAKGLVCEAMDCWMVKQ
jgi:AAA domain